MKDGSQAAGSYPGRSKFLRELTWHRTLVELMCGNAFNHLPWKSFHGKFFTKKNPCHLLPSLSFLKIHYAGARILYVYDWPSAIISLLQND